MSFFGNPTDRLAGKSWKDDFKSEGQGNPKDTAIVFYLVFFSLLIFGLLFVGM